MSGEICDPNLEKKVMLLEYKHDELRDVVKVMAEQQASLVESNRAISDSLGKLTVIEERHSETRNDISEIRAIMKETAEKFHNLHRNIPDNLDKRLNAIEQVIPVLLEARGWAIKILLSVTTVVGAAVMAMVFGGRLPL